MSISEDALERFAQWYDLYGRKPSGEPFKGTVSGALIVLEHLKEAFNLDIDSHTAPKGTQIKNTSGMALKTILANFGETRQFSSEAGRTNRGLKASIETMLAAIADSGISELPTPERNAILESFQLFLVSRIAEFFNQQRIQLIYNPQMTAWETVHGLIATAASKGKSGPVAEYLVGAKLQLRFPDIEIRNKSYSTADEQQEAPGDFLINETAFHVTVAPQPGLYEKCQRNLDKGYRVFILVPYDTLIGTKQNAESVAAGRISVEDIESFVSQNIEELSDFSTSQLANGFRRLLEKYNERVEQVEIDKSVMIELPENLHKVTTEP